MPSDFKVVFVPAPEHSGLMASVLGCVPPRAVRWGMGEYLSEWVLSTGMMRDAQDALGVSPIPVRVAYNEGRLGPPETGLVLVWGNIVSTDSLDRLGRLMQAKKAWSWVFMRPTPGNVQHFAQLAADAGLGTLFMSGSATPEKPLTYTVHWPDGRTTENTSDEPARVGDILGIWSPRGGGVIRNLEMEVIQVEGSDMWVAYPSRRYCDG